MRYSALNLPDVEAPTTQEAAEKFAQTEAERRHGHINGIASDVRFVCTPDNLQTLFEFTAMIGYKLSSGNKGVECSFALWVAGTHQLIDGRLVATGTLGEAIAAQRQAVLTGEADKQAIAGTRYGYARIGTGMMKCVGMIQDEHRDLYAQHYAGLLDTKPHGVPMSFGDKAFFALVPEYMGDQITEAVARLVSLAEYTKGRLTSNREGRPTVA